MLCLDVTLWDVQSGACKMGCAQGTLPMFCSNTDSVLQQVQLEPRISLLLAKDFNITKICLKATTEVPSSLTLVRLARRQRVCAKLLATTESKKNGNFKLGDVLIF